MTSFKLRLTNEVGDKLLNFFDTPDASGLGWRVVDHSSFHSGYCTLEISCDVLDTHTVASLLLWGYHAANLIESDPADNGDLPCNVNGGLL